MIELRNIALAEAKQAMEIIEIAKAHLKEQGIDQWQDGYPDFECIINDAIQQTGYFIVENNDILGYVVIDFGGESAYDTINGKWTSQEKYAVVHRMAFTIKARGKNLTDFVFPLIEEICKNNNIHYIRIDTDEGNKKMQHILKKHGYLYCGIVQFQSTEKIAFDKLL